MAKKDTQKVNNPKPIDRFSKISLFLIFITVIIIVVSFFNKEKFIMKPKLMTLALFGSSQITII